MKIRKYKSSDIERIVRITETAWGDNTLYKLIEDRHGVIDKVKWQDKKVKDIVKFCKENPDNIIIADIDGMVAGYATFSIANSVGYVKNNAVGPEYQGQGIGTAMNQWIIDYFRNNGVALALVSTMEHDKAARHVYEKNGFREITKIVEYSLDLRQ